MLGRYPYLSCSMYYNGKINPKTSHKVRTSNAENTKRTNKPGKVGIRFPVKIGINYIRWN